ncbi:unnamed protein product, partial [Mesorhabditis belari]|uniref:Uncharacterized protein n=1 Tax=Mesorhabditis belari TaxID=2138241 RepID=A0AAF3EV23_9BILA
MVRSPEIPVSRISQISQSQTNPLLFPSYSCIPSTSTSISPLLQQTTNLLNINSFNLFPAFQSPTLVDASLKLPGLEHSINSPFVEFHELRQQVLSWLWLGKTLHGNEPTTSTPSLNPSIPNGNDALSALANLPTGIAQSRKRPASTNQPECPVALRPVPTCPLPPQCFPQVPGFHWPLLAPQVRPPPSPTLPAPPQEQAQENGKWSSPSSVESNGNKTESSTADSNPIDPVGIDASEASSTSSTSTQAMMQSPVQPTPQPAFSFVSKEIQNNFGLLFSQDSVKPPPFYSLANKGNIPVATLPMNGTSSCERRARKQVNDDFTKLIQQYELSGKNVKETDIPVPDAIKCDPTFRPVSEQQIITQITQSKRFDEMDLGECMSNLCKKLAEKRVFGSKLMSLTTVAGPNHSNYNNLPIEGLVYIKDVCRKVFGDKVHSDIEFWDHFRNAMKKLAARCRRVRHAKKTKSIREEAVQLATSQARMNAEAVTTQPNAFLAAAAAVAVTTAFGNNLQQALNAAIKSEQDEKKAEAAETLASLNGLTPGALSTLNLAALSSISNSENGSAQSALARLFPELAQNTFKAEEIKPAF